MQPWHGSRTRLRNSNSCERPRARLRITPGPYGPNLAVGRAHVAAGERTDGPDGTPTVGPSIPSVGLTLLRDRIWAMLEPLANAPGALSVAPGGFCRAYVTH